jgi:hypothetical protein
MEGTTPLHLPSRLVLQSNSLSTAQKQSRLATDLSNVVEHCPMLTEMAMKVGKREDFGSISSHLALAGHILNPLPTLSTTALAPKSLSWVQRTKLLVAVN